MGEVQREHCQSSHDWDQTLSFQYPLRGAFWTFCSPKRRFSAVATVSGRLRSCSAESRSLPTTSPVGQRGCTLRRYLAIVVASVRRSFFRLRVPTLELGVFGLEN